ncbi:MAG TPA: cytochrome c3 family protein [Longimicrobiales bacterium]|nr:cytochrome c3 family protein [Longimicrobiales bacterium]
MAALFPQWANEATRAGLAILVLGAVGVPVALMVWVRTPYARGQERPLEQPVEFDHRHHVVDDGIDCLYCHTLAEKAPTAGIPGPGRCMNCHGQVLPTSPVLAPVRTSAMEARPIRWVRVHRLPDFVFFDHGAHTTAGVGCETCHGRVDRMARVLQMEPLTMGWCLDCHRDPGPNLRPREDVTTMGWRPPDGEDRAIFGRRLARENDVDPGTWCSTCHR